MNIYYNISPWWSGGVVGDVKHWSFFTPSKHSTTSQTGLGCKSPLFPEIWRMYFGKWINMKEQSCQSYDAAWLPSDNICWAGCVQKISISPESPTQSVSLGGWGGEGQENLTIGSHPPRLVNLSFSLSLSLQHNSSFHQWGFLLSVQPSDGNLLFPPSLSLSLSLCWYKILTIWCPF